VRSCHGGRARDKVQTMISTDVMISAAATRLLLEIRSTPGPSPLDGGAANMAFSFCI